MKKFLSILLATLMVVSLVPALVVGAADAAPKASAITAEKNGRIYHYYETFDDIDAVQGANEVLQALEWAIPGDPRKQSAHQENVTATEKGVDSAFMYEIRDGKLFVRNRGNQNEYVTILGSEELKEMFKGAFVIEYTQTYLASSTDTEDGYVSLMYNSNAQATTYAETVVRISGWGNNRLSGIVAPLDAGDVSYSVDTECSLTDYNVINDQSVTLYERLLGADANKPNDINNVPGSTNGASLLGSKVLVNKELRVRIEADGLIGPRVFVNDILVSDPRNIVNPQTRAAAQSNYNDYLAFNGSYLGLCVTPNIDCMLDEIVVYETRGAVKTSSLYITEVATLPANAAAPYIEIYNAGDAAVSLSDYVGGYVAIDEDGGQTVVTVPFKDYIGTDFTVDETEINGLAANKAQLQAGETVLIFPVDPDAPMTVAEFRAEYGLNASQKVLPVSGEDFDVNPTEYRYWFVADLKNANGATNIWSQFSLDELSVHQSMQSIVELVPSVAFGYGDDVSESSSMTNPGEYDFGRGGDVQPGYSAHYVYGANFSTGAKTGLMISRCTELIANSKNVGKLLDVQATYFDRIADYRAGLYRDAGSLAITEFIPVTAENDAYECFEVTNISSSALNLYEFGLVSSGDAAYGGTAWSRATLFDPLPENGVLNPNNGGAYVINPGDSVVIWNKSAAATGKTVADFREYHGLDLDTDVIIATCANPEKNVVAANAGTVSYGIATRADIVKFQNGGSATVDNAVSDVLVPLHSIHYAVDGLYRYTWEDLVDLGCMDVFSAIIEDGSFTGCKIDVYPSLEAGTSLKGFFSRDEVTGIYSSCDDDSVVPEGNTKAYYKIVDPDSFCAYGSKQDTSFPVDAAVAFSYGTSIYANKGSGSLMKAMQVETYKYDLTGRTYGEVRYLVDVINRFITTDIISGATVDHTLGTVEQNQGVSVAAKNPSYYTVTYLDANATVSSTMIFNSATCSNVCTVLTDEYSNWLVNNVKYSAGDKVMLTGNTVIKPVVPVKSDNAPGVGGGEQPPVTDDVTKGESTISLDNKDPNSIDQDDANGMNVLVMVLIAVAGVAVISLGVIGIAKAVKKKKA